LPHALSTHVLDTSAGRPAAGVKLELWRLDPRPRLLKTAVTNDDGRTAAPLLGPEEMAAGTYEIVFFIGDYFAARGEATGGPRFLDRIPVRFGIGDATASFHVPLLVSPWAYSTYRGS
jgi:5-hydroxyisourate hydrolase